MATPDNTDPPNALPRGTRLGEFEVRRVLGVGGFGIVYLAFDHALEREVAVKEYMPASLAGRTATLQVSVLSSAQADTFALGLRSFVNEARLLARFDHPSLVKVHRYWEDNQTAYMAMPFYRGPNLHRVRRDNPLPPTEAWLRGLVDPLLGAIERLHAEAVYHRDISPDNIIVQPDGRPVLLDFGAARRVISDKSLALTAILKPAYAPIEQYAEAGSVKQGPWTDLYALGATVHHQLLGKAPPPATARTVHDDATPLATLALPGCSPGFLHAIDWMLRPRPADRPQSVAALRAVLNGEAAVPEPESAHWTRTQIITPPAEPTQVMPRAEAAPAATAAITAPPASTTELAPTQVLTRTVLTPALPTVAPAATATSATTSAPPARPDAVSAEPPGAQAARPDAAANAQVPVPPPAPAAHATATVPGRYRMLPALLGVVALAGAAMFWLGNRPGAGNPTPTAGPAPLPPALSTTAMPGPPPASAAVAAPAMAPTTAAGANTAAATLATDGRSQVTLNAKAPAANSAGLPAAATASNAAPRMASTGPAGRAATSSGSAATSSGSAAAAVTGAAAAPGTMPALPPTAVSSQTIQAAEPMRPVTLATPAPPSPVASAPATPAAAYRPAAAVAGDPMVQARALSPSERCEGRVLVALYTCIENQCNRMPELRDHPECQKLRRDQDQRSGGGARN